MKYTPFRLPRFVAGLMLGIICNFPLPLHAAGQDVLYSLNPGGVEPCVGCHDDGRGKNIQATDDCGECHGAGNGSIGRETQMRRVAGPGAPLVKLAPPSSGKGPGMRYPRLYSESRLGSAPGEMVLIPAGKFIMGSNERLSDEGPQHSVLLQAYFMDKYEVTNLQYKKFIDATQRKSPDHFRNRTFPRGKADHPVTFVSWQDARDYCAWAGKRLPTDAEWEKAARGTDGRMFPWGNELGLNNANTPMRWKNLNQEGDTTPVGAFAAGVSPYGLYDMSGNVWEWTASWYQAYPGNKKPSENYGELYKTLKGGSWWDCSFYQCGISAPTFNRSFFDPQVKNSSFGFRCAKDEK